MIIPSDGTIETKEAKQEQSLTLCLDRELSNANLFFIYLFFFFKKEKKFHVVSLQFKIDFLVLFVYIYMFV
jgi:hypothetical protein